MTWVGLVMTQVIGRKYSPGVYSNITNSPANVNL